MQLPIKICTTYATTVRRSHICLTTREVKYHDAVTSNTNELATDTWRENALLPSR